MRRSLSFYTEGCDDFSAEGRSPSRSKSQKHVSRRGGFNLRSRLGRPLRLLPPIGFGMLMALAVLNFYYAPKVTLSKQDRSANGYEIDFHDFAEHILHRFRLKQSLGNSGGYATSLEREDEEVTRTSEPASLPSNGTFKTLWTVTETKYIVA